MRLTKLFALSNLLFTLVLACGGPPSAPEAEGRVTALDADGLAVAAAGAGRVDGVGVVGPRATYVKASNTGAIDSFGCSVALSGDTLAIGACLEDSAATGVNGSQSNEGARDSGAVYVFTRVGNGWAQQAYIKASNTGANDQFGCRVALSGDTLAIGACLEDSAATGVNGGQGDEGARDSGAVYVFTRAGGAWSQQAYLKASDTSTGARFGFGLALSGDTLAVGATSSDAGCWASEGAAGGGAVYVFARAGGAWAQQARLTASNAQSNDCFGYSVALAGETLAVGAVGEDGGARIINGPQEGEPLEVDSGAVYVFTRAGSAWSQQAYIKASNADGGDAFGTSVALAGETLAVGAPREDGLERDDDGNPTGFDFIDSGAAYVFTRAGGAWSQQAYLKASTPDFDDHFGHSVALEGGQLAVGSTGEDSAATGFNGDQAGGGAPGSGAVYLFARAGGAWAQQVYLKAPNTGTGDWFGDSLALSGHTLVVGASLENSAATGVDGDQSNDNASSSGAAYLFATSGKE